MGFSRALGGSAVGPKPTTTQAHVGRALLVIAAGIFATLLLRVATGVWLLQVYEPRASTYLAAGRALDRLQTGMLDEQAALRSFVLGDRSQLTRARAARAAAAAANGSLAPRLGGDEELEDRYVAVRLAEQEWTSQWALRAAHAPARRARRAESLRRGSRLFARYERRQQALAADLQAKLAENRRAEWRAIVAGVAGEIVMLIVLGVLAWRYWRRLRGLVAVPTRQLRESLARMRRGDLTTPVPKEGSGELRLIAEDLAATRQALLAATEQAARGAPRRFAGRARRCRRC